MLAPASLDAAEAVARAEDLLARVAAGGPPAMAWSLGAGPALVLGRAAGRPPVDGRAAAEAGVPVVRRPSGGGPVLWGPDLLSLDVVLPRGHRLAPPDVVATYRWLGEAVAAALRYLDVPAEAVGPEAARAWRPPQTAAESVAARACFGSLSPWEVVADGRKVAGLAQARRRAGVLLQAGVPLELDAEALAALLDRGPARRDAVAAALAARAPGVRALRPGLEAPSVVAAVERALSEREGVIARTASVGSGP